MCGISGFLEFKKSLSRNDIKQFSIKMSDSLTRRGPDSSGVWIHSDLNLTLSHRRLSIIDLNKRSDQPMISSNGRFTIVFNGEIFNFRELKLILKEKGVLFKTDCDTEVIVEALNIWGVEKSIKKLNGMFAIAIWDNTLKNLYLTRDRVGIKPLYFYLDNRNFAFASELKALKVLPWLEFEIDGRSLSSYVRLNYIPTPNSIYRNIKKLEPGNILEINLQKKITKKKYWSFQKIAEKNSKINEPINHRDLEEFLKKKVNSHMISDVPLGVFLSGGIDSSLIALLSQRNSSNKINSFTIGFNEAEYNESEDAKKIAKIIGTNHHEAIFSFSRFKDLIEDVTDAYDEPFADSSQLPTMLLSQITKQKVTVALSGDGGDELFGGYYRYFMAENYKKLIFDQPKIFKNLICRIISFVPIGLWNNLGRFLPKKFGGLQFGDKLFKLSTLIKESNENEFYERIISNCNSPSELVLFPDEHINLLFDKEINNLFPNLIDRMQVVDSLTYLPDDILTKVDRASMHNSLEVRVPFLDHEVIEYAWKIPRNQKIKNGEGKRILKKLLVKYIPKNLIEKPKMGFGIPLGKFINTNLKHEFEFLLNSSEIKKQNLFKINKYKEKWEEHKSGKRNWQFLLWNFFIFQKWYSRWN